MLDLILKTKRHSRSRKLRWSESAQAVLLLLLMVLLVLYGIYLGIWLLEKEEPGKLGHLLIHGSWSAKSSTFNPNLPLDQRPLRRS